jgi:hypothetical protein
VPESRRQVEEDPLLRPPCPFDLRRTFEPAAPAKLFNQARQNARRLEPTDRSPTIEDSPDFLRTIGGLIDRENLFLCGFVDSPRILLIDRDLGTLAASACESWARPISPLLSSRNR